MSRCDVGTRHPVRHEAIVDVGPGANSLWGISSSSHRRMGDLELEASDELQAVEKRLEIPVRL